MMWNWQLPKWPQFTYDSSKIASFERQFLQGIGGLSAVLKMLEEGEKKRFVVDVLSDEGVKSAEIEGEVLQRESLQSSIKRHFGMRGDRVVVGRSEHGMGELMWAMYSGYEEVLSHDMLYSWHQLLIENRGSIEAVGCYRSHVEPMQIVSGRYDIEKVFFEAPPSKDVHKEMSRFIKWFNDSKSEPILVRAAIAHVYFESIHPFEDGNGRIGRAIVEKALSQSLGHATLLAISKVIAKRRKEYYEALASCNKSLNLDRWLLFFAEVVVQAGQEALELVQFVIAKSRLMNRLKGKINPRQEKVLLRMFAEGVEGFIGGLSAANYIAITKSSRASATRDLDDLVLKGALRKTGKLKYTRYWINA